MHPEHGAASARRCWTLEGVLEQGPWGFASGHPPPAEAASPLCRLLLLPQRWRLRFALPATPSGRRSRTWRRPSCGAGRKGWRTGRGRSASKAWGPVDPASP